MSTEFKPTHILTINSDLTAVACLDDSWEPCEPGPGAQLVTREEWEAEGSVSYTIDEDGCLCCNGSPTGWGNGSWELTEITEPGVLGEAHGHEDRRHDDGEVRDEDGIEIPAPHRTRIAWTSPTGESEYRAAYRAARGQ